MRPLTCSRPRSSTRANTFEFRVATSDLSATSRPAPIGPADPSFGAGLLQARRQANDATIDEEFAAWMRDVHEILSDADREFGHRTFQEALRFAANFVVAGETDPLVALDRQVAQKVLPRLHGSRRELANLLDRLAAFCFYGPEADQPTGFSAAQAQEGVPALPVSYAKLHRMARKLNDRHFVSFAE